MVFDCPQFDIESETMKYPESALLPLVDGDIKYMIQLMIKRLHNVFN